MNCTYIICIVLWLIPHPIVIWLTCGSTDCNKYIFMYTPQYVNHASVHYYYTFLYKRRDLANPDQVFYWPCCEVIKYYLKT
jgi:hypothetical protein